jgi:hypothetical protein
LQQAKLEFELPSLSDSIIKARDIEIEPCLINNIRWFVDQYHYSHNTNGVRITCCFKAIHKGELVGAVIYGKTATSAWKRFSDSEHKVLELRRLVLLDKCGRNSESRIIGWTIRWIKKHLKYVDIICSYADPNVGHEGVIYKASNFEYLGQTQNDVAYILDNKIYHSRAIRNKYKGKYKPFAQRLRDKKEQGLLTEVQIQGKHCYVYKIKR